MAERREARPRGRAAAEIRTGRFIKQYLERVGETYIAEIHGALKSQIGLRNLTRPKSKWLKVPTYESFYKYFTHLRRLGLVEFVRDEPTEYVYSEKLLSIRMAGPWPDARPLPPMNVVPSTRRIYRLSAFGKSPQADILWDDPLARGLFRQFILSGARS